MAHWAPREFSIDFNEDLTRNLEELVQQSPEAFPRVTIVEVSTRRGPEELSMDLVNG